MLKSNAIEKAAPAAVNACCDQPVEARTSQWTYRPNVDIIDRPEEFVVFADIPGASRDSIDVSVEQNILTISAQVQSRWPKNGAGVRPIRQEYGVGSFDRRFRLMDEVDSTSVTAEYRDGVIAVRLPKRKEARRRQIEISG